MRCLLVCIALGAPSLAAQQIAPPGGRLAVAMSPGGLRLAEWRIAGDTPEDSAYRAARETLNRGEYRRAADQFASFGQKYPDSRYRPAAVYWRAFALYRAGAESDLRQALSILDDLQKNRNPAANEAEVNALVTRVVGTLAARGDAAAAARLREGASKGVAACDQEDVEVRGEALSALVQNDPAGSLPVLRRILARRDECSVTLRRRAIYLLGKDGDPGRAEEVLEVARTDPSPQVRNDAISRLAQIPGERATTALEQFLAAGGDPSSQRAVIQALRGRDDAPSARLIRRVIEQEEYPDRLRVEAIQSLAACCPGLRGATPIAGAQEPVMVVDGAMVRSGGQAGGIRQRPTLAAADVALLKAVYERTKAAVIREAIVETMARSAGPAVDGWIVSLIRNPNEDIRLRSAALGRLQRSETSIEELGKLYDALTERELRQSLVRILGQRDDDGATDKLVEIAKNSTDPSVRRSAISALTRKKDPRSLKLLLEIVEK